jgi:hypothetical protein
MVRVGEKDLVASYAAQLVLHRTNRPSNGLDITFFPGALERLLVFTKAQEGGLPKLGVARPLGEGDLCNQLWKDPDGSGNTRHRIERRAFDAKRPHSFGQVGKGLCRESGSHLSDKPQVLALIETDEQRAEMMALPCRMGVPPKNEFGLFSAFYLEPTLRAGTCFVERRIVFCDDPLPTFLLRPAIGSEAVAGESARPHQNATPSRHDGFDRLSAFLQGLPR